jgi:hypothetical protein
MLFGSGKSFSGMFATHPPLTERIQALDTNFKENDYPHVDPRRRQIETSRESQHAAFAGNSAAAVASSEAGVLATSIAATVGQPRHQHVEFARELRLSIPETLYTQRIQLNWHICWR